jgi:hypothetical protein
MPTGDDLVRRVEERGGEIRLCRSTIQYRPPSVLTMEAKWIRDHGEEVVRALAAPDPSDADAFRSWVARRFGLPVFIGSAGQDTPVWLPIRSDHAVNSRPPKGDV